MSGDCGAGFGSSIGAKTNAQLASASAPTSSAVTSSTATVACNYFPNTLDSTATVKMQYRKLGDVPWIDAPGGTDTQSGYTQKNISRNLTGLLASTTYEFRLDMTRTTNNGTTLNSSVGSFTTSAAAPQVTTNAATSVSSNSATLNATVNPQGFTDVEYRFAYDTDSGTPYANATAWTALGFSDSSDHAVSAGISGLTGSTQYFFRAEVRWNGGANTANGSELNFTTAADPAAEAAQEDHMLIFEYDGKYGVATTVYFTLASPAATSSDRFVTTAPGSLFASGDIKVSKDGGAFNNAVNSVAQVAASNPLYSLALDPTTEMNARDILVQIVDQNGPAFRDALIHVRTKLLLGQIDVDATQIGGNTDALKLTGVGTGYGLNAVGGSTSDGDIFGTLSRHVLRKGLIATGGANPVLDSGASATNDYYNGCLLLIVAGTGAGQARVIVDYDGTSKAATPNRAWSTNPGTGATFLIVAGEDVWNISPSAELASQPAPTAAYGDKLQFVFQRFGFKRTQTATTQTLFKSDNSTPLSSGSVSDDGTTQTSGKLS